ncbi:MAG: hypothetical protein M3004_03615 [Bacteroidota bacterium]|nr:hypothetical protein [Bacteroidota bacterium]
MKYIFLNLFLLFTITSQAQTFNGVWEGLFHTEPDAPDKNHSFFVHLELKENGKQIKGFFYNAPDHYAADVNAMPDVSEESPKKIYFPLMKGYQLSDKLDTDAGDLFFEFDEIFYLLNDTTQFLYGKWFPTGYRSPRSDGAIGAFWVRKVDTSDNAIIKRAIAKTDKPKTITKKAVLKTYEERRNLIAETFISHEKEVNLEFYDNGVVDGDIISVYVNNEPVLLQRKLNLQPIKLSVPLEKNKEYTITMFAENLGIYPPNTAVMIINSGYVRKTVFLSADLNSNASVIFKRE